MIMKKGQFPLWASQLKGDWFNFISIYRDPSAKPSARFQDKILSIDCPKNLMVLTKEKAIGSMAWWRKITASKKYPCFIYCPDVQSIFKKNRDYNYKIIEKLVKEQNGDIDFLSIHGKR